MPSDIENWNADMAAWRLSPDQRVHHLRRLLAHHQRLAEMYWGRYERTSRLEFWFALAALVSLALSAVLLLASP
jgi:hypothetical protein